MCHDVHLFESKKKKRKRKSLEMKHVHCNNQAAYLAILVVQH